MVDDVDKMKDSSETSGSTQHGHQIDTEMSVEDVQAWIEKTLTKWGSSEDLIKLATDSVLTKRIDGQALFSSVSEGEERISADMSLPKLDETDHADAEDSEDHESLIKRHAQRLLDTLSAKVLCNAAKTIHGRQAEARFSAAELVLWVGQSLGENATKTGTAEHAICKVLENMKMDCEGMCMLLPGDAHVLVPLGMRPCSLDVTDTLSRIWLRLRNVALSGNDNVGALVVCLWVGGCGCGVCHGLRTRVCICVLCVCVCVCIYIYIYIYILYIYNYIHV
jgi:hypothetical protein